jgi:hypothetical protein
MVLINTKPKWIRKGCPKCRGDLYRDGDEYNCLQCGHIHRPGFKTLEHAHGNFKR